MNKDWKGCITKYLPVMAEETQENLQPGYSVSWLKFGTSTSRTQAINAKFTGTYITCIRLLMKQSFFEFLHDYGTWENHTLRMYENKFPRNLHEEFMKLLSEKPNGLCRSPGIVKVNEVISGGHVAQLQRQWVGTAYTEFRSSRPYTAVFSQEFAQTSKSVRVELCVYDVDVPVCPWRKHLWTFEISSCRASGTGKYVVSGYGRSAGRRPIKLLVHTHTRSDKLVE
jgi:hypothetical protein